jgi:2-phosphosulfolactate phosphatase
MRIVHAIGIEGARAATSGAVVVIDVLRAFTVSAFALAGGARECLLVPTVDEARALAESIPGALISAEENTLPIPGIDISNSPTLISSTELQDRTLVQRTSAGTPVINAVRNELDIYAGSLVVARATAQACLLRRPDTVTLIASGDFPEDHACARYMEAVIEGRDLDPQSLLASLYASERYAKFAKGDWPGFPKTDLDLSLAPDRFDFAMPAHRDSGHVRLTVQRRPAGAR